MSVSNVNMISSYFSYGVKDIKITQIFENLIKFMVRGYDPLPIESIVVTSGVARVTTSEKKFYSLPGCKLVISGTNNPLLDTKQEIQEVFNDGFSFNTEATDSTYNIGLQYAVPGLGWSLIKSTELICIFKSGSSALTPFYLVFELDKVNYWTIKSYICNTLDNFNNPLDYYPKFTYQIVNLLPYSNYNQHYEHFSFFYGNDSFVIVGNTTGNGVTGFNSSLFTGCSISCFGQAEKSYNNVPVIINFGQPYDTVNYNTNSYPGAYSYYNIPISGKNYSGGYLDFHNKAHYIKDNKLSSFNVTATAQKYLAAQYSGQSFTNFNPFSSKIKKLEFQPMQILDFNYQKVGFIPGVYFIDRLSNFISAGPFDSIKLTINGKIRNCFFIKAQAFFNDINQTIHGGPSEYGYSLIDLTGPIN